MVALVYNEISTFLVDVLVPVLALAMAAVVAVVTPCAYVDRVMVVMVKIIVRSGNFFLL